MTATHTPPDAVRESTGTPEVAQLASARPGGTPGLAALGLAALVCSPAIWQCLVRQAMPFEVMLGRYVVVALACLLVAEAARRYLGAVSRPAGPADDHPADGPTPDGA